MRHGPPITVSSNMLTSEAKKVFDQHRLLFIPVVDEGELRGILARRDLREAAHHVSATQNPFELEYFNTRLKVKDLMVRNPITMSTENTVSEALVQGRKLGRSFYPVIDDDKLVGTVSDIDIFNSLSQIMGAYDDEQIFSFSLLPDEVKDEKIPEIINLIHENGGVLFSFFKLKQPNSGDRRIHFRFKGTDPQKVRDVIKNQGYSIEDEEI